jgi:hypothetical protein
MVSTDKFPLFAKSVIITPVTAWAHWQAALTATPISARWKENAAASFMSTAAL